MSEQAKSDDRLSQVFAALANPTRRDLVERLTNGDATVGELAEPYKATVQAVSKHLKVLEQAGLVSRSGRPTTARCTSSACHPDDSDESQVELLSRKRKT